jgi:hypothetical protein
MKKYKLYGLIVATLFVLFLGFKIFRFFQIDVCLDGGGKWDYEKNECKY